MRPIWILLLAVIPNVVYGQEKEMAPTFNGWGALVDPDGDCKIESKSVAVSIRVPGTPHDLSAELDRMNAPRIMSDVSGNFVAEVTVEAEFNPGDPNVQGRAAYNGAGLLLMQDAGNYIRLERAVFTRLGQTRHYVNFEQRRNGEVVRLGSSADFPVDPTMAATLRLEKWDNEVRGAVRQGTGKWFYLSSQDAQLEGDLSVGVAAVNASTIVFEPTFSNLSISELEHSAIPSDADEKDMIVYQNSAIYVMRPDGSGFRRRHRDEQRQWHGGPIFSPSGSRLAWDAHQPRLTAPAVLVGDAEGNVQHTLEGATRPIWLDDNVLLVNHDRSIYRVDLNDIFKRDRVLDGLYASLSANRRYLVYAEGTSVIVYNLATKEATKFQPNPPARAFNGFDVSNDGTKVVYVGLQPSGQAVYLADVNEGIGSKVADEDGQEYFPSFSPDESRVLFTAGSITLGVDDTASRTYVVDLESGQAKAISPEGFHCRDPSWSDDGELIALSAIRVKPATSAQQD